MVGFTEQHHLLAIADNFAVEIDSHAAWARFKLRTVIRHKSIRHDLPSFFQASATPLVILLLPSALLLFFLFAIVADKH